MGNLFGSLEIGRRSLEAQQFGLQVTGNNIANINTPGYHREQAILETSPPEQTPAGLLGTGVDVTKVTSARDQFVELRIAQSTQSAAKQDATSGYLSQVESVFGPTQSGIQNGISQLFNSFSTLSTDPSNPALRYGVVSAAQNLAGTFRDASQQLDAISDSANKSVSATVTDINGLTAKIAELNKGIVSGEMGGAEASALRDQRSQAVNQLSSLVDIHYFEASDGSLTVSTGTGNPLVTAGFSQNLTAVSTGPNGFFQVHSGSSDITSGIQGGRLGGALSVRDQLIPGYKTSLDTLAQNIITQVNTVHRGGTDLQGPPPTSPGLNLFNPAATVAGAAAGFSVNSVVAGDVRYIAAGQSGSPGDNANALALANLGTQKLLGGGTQTFAEAFSALQFTIGTDQQSASTSLNTQNALLTQLNNSRDSVSGVSLDDEAVNLIRFQRAYQAAARFVSVMDQLTADMIATFSK
jgi:flagellar hook-associated protein 1 FlgK